MTKDKPSMVMDMTPVSKMPGHNVCFADTDAVMCQAWAIYQLPIPRADFQGDGAHFSFSVGRIALLASAQRQIRVSRRHIPLNHHRRKQLPSVIQTLGDYIQAKRYEKGLHPYQVAAKLGIAASLVSAWERGTSTPDERQWQSLSTLLSFDAGVNFPKPHR
jgi:DNA-binding transcriptional regulator YiaG